MDSFFTQGCFVEDSVTGSSPKTTTKKRLSCKWKLKNILKSVACIYLFLSTASVDVTEERGGQEAVKDEVMDKIRTNCEGRK